ncbi:MAG: hypothetical protein LCH41_09795 [Armatimonadetes bacterium]|nr:hypothetical protein [Armatimonadota bacterium]
MTSAHGVVIPIDDLRLWVRSGLADSVPWTDETERQFTLAEEGAFRLALVYLSAGFDVWIDHCRNLPRWENLLDSFAGELAEVEVRKILVLPALEVNLAHNASRTNKDFDPALLVETIEGTYARYEADLPGVQGWEIVGR